MSEVRLGPAAKTMFGGGDPLASSTRWRASGTPATRSSGTDAPLVTPTVAAPSSHWLDR